MILRIASLAVMGVALLYGAEALGVVEERKYLPSLPRLETSTPTDWLSAGEWLVSTTACLIQSQSLNQCTEAEKA